MTKDGKRRIEGIPGAVWKPAAHIKETEADNQDD